MKIYTKNGDDGSTSLPGGERVSKASPRVRAYGDLEELACWIGHLAGLGRWDKSQKDGFRRLVNQAMAAGASIALDKGSEPGGPGKSTAFLENWIDQIQGELPKLTKFIIPMGSRGATECHLVRTTVRRIERDLAAMKEEISLAGWVLPWINRLSDLLFVMARLLNHMEGYGDPPFDPDGAFKNNQTG